MSWADQNLPEADVIARIDALLLAGDQSGAANRRAHSALATSVSPGFSAGFDWTMVADGVIDYE